MRIAATLLALALTGCATPGLPVDQNLGSFGREDPSLIEAKVVSIDLNSGVLFVDVRKVNGKASFRNGARVEADESTMFYNNSRYDEIRDISQIPGTIVEIEGWNDHGIYRALTIALIDVPPDHPVWRPKGANR
jgi:hypothetical protein